MMLKGNTLATLEDMNGKIKTVAVMTGGGDCPGLNAAIRAVVKSLIKGHGLNVLGIYDAFQGMHQGNIGPITFDMVSEILFHGGTVLGTNNAYNPFRVPADKDAKSTIDVSEICIKHLKDNQVDGLIVIGGDGTMSISSQLSTAFVQKGINIPIIGIPKTIDNDVFGTEITIGFDTVIRTASDALKNCRDTAGSHHRVLVVEVMGRYAGWIALYAGASAGADVILIPEIPYELDKVCGVVVERSRKGRRYSIAVISEGAKEKGGEMVVAERIATSPDPIRLGGIANKLCKDIEGKTGMICKAVVLGQVQRGGTPTHNDIILATELGSTAVELLMKGYRNEMVTVQNGTISRVPLSSVAEKIRNVPTEHHLIKSAIDVGTSFGI